MLFVKYQNLLKSLSAALLRIRVEDIDEFKVTNPEMPPEGTIDGRKCRLDINMVVDGQILNLEIQVDDEHNFPERTLFHWARLYSSSLGKGGEFSKLPRTVVASIVDFRLFDCLDFHSEFEALEVKRHDRLTDRLSLHYFELSKLPAVTGPDDALMLWLKLFEAKTEEDLSKIQEIGGSIMEMAVQAYRHVSGTPEFQELERLRFDAACREATALAYAREEGWEKGKVEGWEKGKVEGWEKGVAEEKENTVKAMKAEGIDVTTIAKITGLTSAHISRL
jgi:predicted transposase/invertase (TIGR01784 family)